MGYNSKCYSQDCSLNCCNTQGNCPSSTAQCKYYYTTQTNSGLIAGLVLGGIFAVTIIITVICYCYRKNKAQKMLNQLRSKEQLNITHQQLNNLPKAAYYQPNHLQTNFGANLSASFSAQTNPYGPYGFPQIPASYGKEEIFQSKVPPGSRPAYSNPPFTRPTDQQAAQQPIVVMMM